LLISILLPSLDAARRQAKQSACLAHIKNIATSSRVYEADDPSGWGIPVHPLQFLQDPDNPTFVGAYEWGGKSGIGRPGFVSAGGVTSTGEYAYLSSRYGTAAGYGPSTRPMNNILYPGGFKDSLFGAPYLGASGTKPWDRRGAERDKTLELDLFKCPGDDGPPRAAHCTDWVENQGRSSYDHFGNSYAANIFFVHSTGGGCEQSNSPYMRPTSRVPTPARTLFYEENIGRWAYAVRNRDQCSIGGADGLDPGPTKTVRGWHGKDWTFDRAFVDGHAAVQKIYREGTEDGDGYAFHFRVEELGSYPPVEGLPPGQDTRDFYRCIVDFCQLVLICSYINLQKVNY